MSFYPLEKISNIAEGYLKRFDVNGRDMLLVNSGGNTCLIDNRCPHDGSSLVRARVAKGCLQCPKHKIVFRLDDGLPLGGDAVEGIDALSRIELVIQGDMIGVFLTDR